MQENNFDKQFKKHILHVFKYAVSFFERHNLRYVACGGTVLGAVRHKDFIPWDDDMDIYMPREDYERLLNLKQEVCRDGFDVLSLRDEGYYLPFAKISDRKTTLWEMEEFPFIMGVFIDIFPLDNFSCSDTELTAIQRKSLKRFWPYLKSVSHIRKGGFWKDLLKGDLERAQYKIESLCYRPFSKRLLNVFLRYQDWYSSHDGNKTVCVTQWPGKIFRREWFEDTIDQPFGDIIVRIPRDYDGYLTCLYGDYMTPPSVEQQVSDHLHYYLNFDEGLTLDEVRQRMKNPSHSK